MRAGALALAALLLAAALAASPGEPPAVPERLSDTGLVPLGRRFSPQYPLWSDGASKVRWVYLPPGQTIDAREETAWDFPAGTRFWKEFAVNGRKVETRMLWKHENGTWTATSYVWNEDGTDAVRAPAEGLVTGVELSPGRRYVIPSQQECLMCHGTKPTRPLGFNALQLSTDRDPGAIHGEPLVPGMVTLRTLVDEGRPAPVRHELVAHPPRIRTRHAATRAVLGYLWANCGSCHDGSGEIAALGPVLKIRDLLQDGDAVAATMMRQATKWQVPGVAEGRSVVVDPANPEQSALLVRMSTRRPSSQMPPLGTVRRDEAAIDAVRTWMRERGTAAVHARAGER